MNRKVPGRRRRVVVSTYSYNFCKACRKRRVKCDGRRPDCGNCVRIGVECVYSSWELAVRDPDDAVIDVEIVATLPSTAVSEAQAGRKQHPSRCLGGVVGTLPRDTRPDDVLCVGAANRAQLMASFLRDRFPRGDSVGPYANHMHNSSLPFLCAQVDFSTPLLQRAIDTICLAHLANKSKEPWIVHQASFSRGRLLNQLRGAVLLHKPFRTSTQVTKLPPTRPPNVPPTNAQGIMLTIMLLTIAPSLTGDSDVVQRQSAVHLEGALQFLTKYGLDFLTGHAELDSVLIRQLQFQGAVVAVARRKNLEFANPEWAQVPRILLDEELAIYAKSGYLTTDAQSRWQSPLPSPASVDHNLIRTVFVPLPKHLEAADAFAKGSGPHSQEDLDNLAAAVRRAHDVYTHSVLPGTRHSASTTCGPMLTIRDIHEYNLDIEEHVYLLQNPNTITKQYRFISPRYTFPSINLHQACLLTNTASVKIIEHGMQSNGLAADWTGVRKAAVEHAAYTSAFEICQHVHYISQRSLTAARFLHAFVASARAFFRCFGAVEEAEWCDGCLGAIEARIERLASGPDAESLCPVLNAYEMMVDGCNYK